MSELFTEQRRGFFFFSPQKYHFASSKDFVSKKGQMSFPNAVTSYRLAWESSWQQGFLHSAAVSWAVGVPTTLWEVLWEMAEMERNELLRAWQTSQ